MKNVNLHLLQETSLNRPHYIPTSRSFMESIFLKMAVAFGTNGIGCLSRKNLHIRPNLAFQQLRGLKASKNNDMEMSNENWPPVSPFNRTPPASCDIQDLSHDLIPLYRRIRFSSENLVLPVFIHEGDEDIPVRSMPGVFIFGWKHGLLEEVSKACDVGVNSVLLYPKVPAALKTPTGDEAYNENGLVPRTIRLLKERFPNLVIYTDVALDLYSHDRAGFLSSDECVHLLCKQAVSHARAGAQVVSVRVMMAGCVGAIRTALESEGFGRVSIMAYTNYPNSLDGPFRDAVGLGDGELRVSPDERFGEAFRKLQANTKEAEGADILLAEPSLDTNVITALRWNTSLPVAAFQTSSEYSRLAGSGWHGLQQILMERLIWFRVAGADIVITYFAIQAAACLKREK